MIRIVRKETKISVITPTFQREAHLIRQYAHFKAQTYPQKEWLIWDDSPAPSAFFLALTDPEVRYIHTAQRLTIGEKRNRLAALSTGHYIAHFDDDDYYAPRYLEVMASHLASLDFVKLSGWFVYSEKHDFWGYCDHAHPAAVHYRLRANGPLDVITGFESDDSMLWGYGFSYAYRRDVWEAFGFEPVNFGEDHTLVLDHVLNSPFQAGYFADTEGMVLHLLHQTNASESFPQYRLPQALIPEIFQAFHQRVFSRPPVAEGQEYSKIA
jgi:glycosyltransferase involved in cell wall biosynthesis